MSSDPFTSQSKASAVISIQVDSRGLWRFKDDIWVSNWSWAVVLQFHCSVKQGALVFFYRLLVRFMRFKGAGGWGALIKGEIDRSRMCRCHILSSRTAITGYGQGCLSSCLGLYRCTTWVEVKFTPGTLRQHTYTHTQTHTHKGYRFAAGCGGQLSLTEGIVFYHFVYLLATKSETVFLL